jgi:hypothetical protein
LDALVALPSGIHRRALLELVLAMALALVLTAWIYSYPLQIRYRHPAQAMRRQIAHSTFASN